MVVFNLQSCSAPLVLKMGKQKEETHNRRDQRDSKSLANRKGFCHLFPNIGCPFLLRKPRKSRGAAAEPGWFVSSWMTMLETHTPGRDTHVWEKAKRQNGRVLYLVLGFNPNRARGELERQKNRKEEEPDTKCASSNTSDAPPSNPDQPQCLQSCSSTSDTSKNQLCFFRKRSYLCLDSRLY